MEAKRQEEFSPMTDEEEVSPMTDEEKVSPMTDATMGAAWYTAHVLGHGTLR